MNVFVGLLCLVTVTGLVLGRPPNTDADSACRLLADTGDCAFYRCFSARHPCVHDLLARGAMFHGSCVTLDARKDDMTAQGRAWLTNSRLCLFAHLKTMYGAPDFDCGHFMPNVVGGYMQCTQTVRPAICDVYEENKPILEEVFSLTDTQIQEDWRAALYSLQALNQMSMSCLDDSDSFGLYINDRNALVQAVKNREQD